MNVPENPWLSLPAVIEEVRPEIDSVTTLTLRLQDEEKAARYRFAPGQFNMLYVPGCGEVAISMSGPISDDGNRIVHTIRTVGRVTQAISQLRPDDVLGVRGPMGTPWPMEAIQGRDVILVTGGLGMAPLRPVVYELMREPSRFGRCTLLFGARSPDLLLYASELDAWRASGIDVHLTVDRADAHWHGHVGVVPLLIDRLANLEPSSTSMLLCGPEIMMHFSAKSALARGIAPENLWLSMERNMQCAFGMCGHCQWGSHFVCRNGPVLRYDVAEPFLRVRDL
jgi:NAD(P)H-flavin reductase